MNIRTEILLRVYIAFGLIVLFALAVLFKLFNVQFVHGNKWRAMADSLSTRYVNVEAVRGNIYSVDGSLLATSVPEYDIRMDLYAGGIESDEIFYEKVDSLARKLSSYFGDKSFRQYSRMLRTARRDSNRYFLIQRRISHQQLQDIKRFPIFNMGRYRGGLIAVQKNKRILPFKALAARTIGYKNKNVQPVGLEGAYAEYIDGESGKQLMQKIAGGVWMPVNRDIEIAPTEGADIISTIDINMQDVAQDALERQLITSDADYGCVVLMEVKTGEIRAVSNLSKISEGVYRETFNYAIAQSAEPGSTFKLASYMAALEDHKVDTNTVVDCEGGRFKVYNITIRDSHEGNHLMTVKQAFEESSNVAVAKVIYEHYKEDPLQFVNRLYSLHLDEKLGLQIPGEGKPLIKNPSSRYWSGVTLAQMAYGYESKMTPLQMLTLYNAVANNGRMIAPLFVREIRRLGNTVALFKAREINDQICSGETLGKLRAMLEGVVLEGTGKELNNPLYKIAGKTGTAGIAQGSSGYGLKKAYQASFCGYFPADKPKYSMIVVIGNPTKGSYYAAHVAGPVFREVADQVYVHDTEMYTPVQSEKMAAAPDKPPVKAGYSRDSQLVFHSLGISAPPLASAGNNEDGTGSVYKEGVVPDVRGMGLKDALFLIGNAGLRPVVKGSGQVVKQSVAAGLQVPKGFPLMIELN